jgi:hypothetical protein
MEWAGLGYFEVGVSNRLNKRAKRSISADAAITTDNPKSAEYGI